MRLLAGHHLKSVVLFDRFARLSVEKAALTPKGLLMRNKNLMETLQITSYTAFLLAAAVVGRAPMDTSDPARNGARPPAASASVTTPHRAP